MEIMIVAPVEDSFLKTHLEAIPQDEVRRFTLLSGTIRGALVSGTHLVAQAQANHGLGILETVALGQALLSTVLLSTTLKEGMRAALKMDCTGVLRGFSTETSWDGKVRGYLYNPSIRLDRPLESFDLKPFIGQGTLQVIRKDPTGTLYTGHVPLVHGRIAEDLTVYFLRSEQTKTACMVSVSFDTEGRLWGAGGLFMQAMPGALDLDMEDTEDRLRELPSLGNWFGEGRSSNELLMRWFSAFEPVLFSPGDVQFSCDCSAQRFLQFIRTMPLEERRAMVEQGPLPVEVVCHYCNSRYYFKEADIL